MLELFDKGLMFLHNLNNFLIIFVVIGYAGMLAKNLVLKLTGNLG